MQKDATLSKLAAMEGAVPKQLQPAFKKVMQKLQQVVAHALVITMAHSLSPFRHTFSHYHSHWLSLCSYLTGTRTGRMWGRSVCRNEGHCIQVPPGASLLMRQRVQSDLHC